jgi:hypothetical protein
MSLLVGWINTVGQVVACERVTATNVVTSPKKWSNTLHFMALSLYLGELLNTTKAMNCPICKSDKVEDNTSQCPECESDLTTFALISDVSKERSSLRKATTFLAVLTLLTLAGWAFTYYDGMADAAIVAEEADLPDNLAADETEILEKALAAKDEEITKLNNRLAELHATIESSVNDLTVEDSDGVHKLHIVKAGESLWSISELYHGHGFKHHHIAGHNKVDNPDHIEIGDTLAIQN